jgi:hypothetical protein
MTLGMRCCVPLQQGRNGRIAKEKVVTVCPIQKVCFPGRTLSRRNGVENGAKHAEIEEGGIFPAKICQKGKGWLVLTLVRIERLSSQVLLSSDCKNSDIEDRLPVSKRPFRTKFPSVEIPRAS